jgi:hypothetical protein
MQKRIILSTVILLFISVTIFISSCKKTEDKVPGCTNSEALNYNSSANEDDGSCIASKQKQNTVVINLTSLTCSSCGSYGIPALTSSYTTYPNDVVPLKVNLDDALQCPISYTIAGNYVSGSFGIPYFIVGNQNNVSSSSINSTVAGQITASAIASPAGILTVSGNSVSVQTQVKFFSAASGDYYLAVYLMENGLSASQSGASTNPWIHNHVMRGNIAGSGGFGESIATGSITSGKLINKTYTATLTSGWNAANIYAALVIWKKNGSKYDFVNAFQTKAN